MPRIREGAENKRKRASSDARKHVFATLTAQQAATWIDNNVTNLASAKTALKRLAEMIIYLRDNIGIED